MSDPKRPSFRAFIRRLNPGKGNESSSDSIGTPASTPPVSQGRLPAGLPSASASSMSVSSVNVAVTKDPLPGNVSVGCSASMAEHGDTISTTDYECKDQQVRFQQLWKEAIDNAKASKGGGKLSEVIRVQEQAAAEDAEITLPALIKRLETEMKRFGTQKRLAEAMERIVPHLNRFAVVGDIAVSTNPNPAALPWAAVRFLLLNLTAREEIRGKVVEGIAEITVLVFECSVYHELYLASPASTDLPINTNLRQTIIDALSHCVRFLGFALRRQQAAAKAFTDVFRLEDFTGYLKDLNLSKDKLHDAGSLCEIHQSSRSRDQLKSLHDLMIDIRLESSERAEEKVKAQLRDLLIDPKDVFDHIYHPHNSFCLEGTRTQVLDDIEQWAHNPSSPSICWLPGLAGTGKSTISRTVSRNLKTKTLGASFFFKKGAGNRGNGRHLFSILAYQLALHLPRILPYILDSVKEDHSLAMAPIQVQWQKLILNPLVKLQEGGLTKPIVFVLDALDECDEQDRGELLRLLLATCPGILRVFLTSRPELDIVGHFANEPLHREIVLHKLDLGTIESDFLIFLRQALESFVVEYNRTHHQKHLQLPSDWPGDERFQVLLHKSLPLFIAAATFVRMICDRHWSKSPNYKIDFIIDNSTKVNSEYEALYKPVLSLILSGAPDEDQDEVKQSFCDIIGSLVLLASPLPVTSLANLLGTDVWDIFSQIDPLRSVIDVPEDDSPLQLFHLSFRDYILSQSAGDLQVNEMKTHADLAKRCLGLMRVKLKTDICRLEAPGRSHTDVEPSVLDEHLPPEIQYACLYWVHHLRATGGRVCDGDDASSFLQRFFRNWLEVLCLLRRLDDSLLMLEQLQSIVDETSGTQLQQFIQDAIQFIRYFRAGIEQTPLQLYHSGTIFSPKASIAPSRLEDRQYPDYILQPSNIDLCWPQSQTFEVLGGKISRMAFLSDKKLATICRQGNLKIWDQKYCSCLHSLSQGSPTPMVILTCHDSRTVAVGWSEMIKIWNLDTVACIRTLFLQGYSDIDSIAFSDDGRFICSVCRRDPERVVLECMVLIHCVGTGECVSEFDIPDETSIVSLSPRGQWIATVAEGSMLISKWRPSTEPSWIVLGPQHKDDLLSFSTDGLLVASLSRTSKVVTVYNTESRECLHRVVLEARVVNDEFSMTKDWLLVSLEGYRTLILDMKTGEVTKELSGDFIAGPVISHDGTLLAGQSVDRAVKMWDLTSEAMTESTSEQAMGIELVAPISDGNTILSHSWGIIRIWDMESATCKEKLEPVIPLIAQTSIAAATDVAVFAVLEGTSVEVWYTDPLRCVTRFMRGYTFFEERYHCLAISANGERLAVGSSLPGLVEIWDVNNALLEYRLELPLHDYPRIAFSHDGAKIAYLLMERIEVRSFPGFEKLTITSEVYPQVSFIRDLAFRDGRLIGIYDNTHVQVWDASTGACLFLSQPCPDLRMFYFSTNFVNTVAIAHSDHSRTDNVLGTIYIG
ncbi:hypothetical protein FOXG_14506 [Fusarium oxysporum f. sp. lycopersici 4287]|uniref:Nephrocystin 3-like N-terminal domain-containing protein n=2 Tax=Fusarium oxysporum TaxID=5507 RepID=A0A0J9VYW8_FUSO4|nr:hypothetical protein FOXG_14506 [Fusarium oxysporum f. sp. lycopersici 4287]KNB16028.1 hypothetical protein FOXG_14506 [Fusarium oxysporum f. sp. lycopersici 4287]